VNGDLRSALIVGGGVAGMAAAISLRKVGVAVDLIDRDPDWRTYGAGITITGPTLRAFHHLGVLDEVGAVGALSDHVKFFTRDGEFIRKMPAPPLLDGLPGTGGIMRPALHRILSERTMAAGTAVHLGQTVAAFEQDEAAVLVQFSDGREARYDLLIGADGSHSTLREQLFPTAPPLVFTGQGCWRMLADRPADVDSAEIYFGPDSVKIGFNPCTADKMYVFATISMHGNPHIPDDDLPDGMRRILEPFGGRVARIREAIGPDSAVNYRPLFAMLLPPPWHVGRVGLIGDAAHATTPHLASGAGIAIEDGLVLADEMARAPTVEAGWSAFAARRYDRARLVVQNSVEIGRLEQAGGHDDEIMALMSDSTHALAAAI
jgi:2-polyprenyl-6-methoxyphenol hydroxylase-like FAD-dependent oxidoreductase